MKGIASFQDTRKSKPFHSIAYILQRNGADHPEGKQKRKEEPEQNQGNEEATHLRSHRTRTNRTDPHLQVRAPSPPSDPTDRLSRYPTPPPSSSPKRVPSRLRKSQSEVVSFQRPATRKTGTGPVHSEGLYRMVPIDWRRARKRRGTMSDREMDHGPIRVCADIRGRPKVVPLSDRPLPCAL